jgi:hypothetical protein
MFIALTVSLAAGGAAGYKLRDMQAKSEAVSALDAANRKSAKLQDALNKVSTDYENFKANSNVVRETRTNTVREIYRNVEVDPGCAPVPAAVGVLDAAISSANSAASSGPRR